MKLFKLITFVIIITILQLGCKRKVIQNNDVLKIADNELIVVKKTILDGYKKNDSIFYSPQENCFFESYVNNELCGPYIYKYSYYDRIYQGISIKYFFCEYTNFHFALLKGSEGKFYYIGFSDDIRDKMELMKFYTKSGNVLKRNNMDSLILENRKSREVIEINSILNDDLLFKIPENDIYSNYRINKAFGLIYNIFQEEIIIGGYMYEPKYTFVFNDELILKSFIQDTLCFKNVLNEIRQVQSQSHNIRFVENDRMGAYLWSVEYLRDSLVFSKRFIPRDEIIIRTGFNDLTPANSDCLKKQGKL